MRFSLISFAAVLVLLFSACKQQKVLDPIPDQTSGNLTIEFLNQVNGGALDQGQLLHANTAGNAFSVDLLKYYVTNVVLINEDGTEHKAKNYDLIDAFDPNFSTVEIQNVPNGRYTSMKFFLGVDSSRNHSGAQDGDLDPSWNMIWNWNTGYIFFKHEGKYKDSLNAIKGLQLHLGTDKALTTIQIPIDLTIAGTNKKMHLVFDLYKMYNAPVVDFNTDNLRMSDRPADAPWIANMAANTGDVFSFKDTE